MRGASPPIIFKRLKLITSKNYIRSKRELMGESKSELKCRENILISQFLEQFSRSNRNLGHFWKFEKFQKVIEHKHIMYYFEVGDLDIPDI